MLRILLALTPTDAMVEAAFNRLTQILSRRRLSLRPSLVEQLLILAPDAQMWEHDDYTTVYEMVQKNAWPARFRLAWSDKGVTGDKPKKRKGNKGNQEKAKKSEEAKATDVYSDSDSDCSASSPSLGVHCAQRQSRKRGACNTKNVEDQTG